MTNYVNLAAIMNDIECTSKSDVVVRIIGIANTDLTGGYHANPRSTRCTHALTLGTACYSIDEQY